MQNHVSNQAQIPHPSNKFFNMIAFISMLILSVMTTDTPKILKPLTTLEYWAHPGVTNGLMLATAAAIAVQVGSNVYELKRKPKIVARRRQLGLNSNDGGKEARIKTNDDKPESKKEKEAVEEAALKTVEHVVEELKI